MIRPHDGRRQHVSEAAPQARVLPEPSPADEHAGAAQTTPGGDSRRNGLDGLLAHDPLLERVIDNDERELDETHGCYGDLLRRRRRMACAPGVETRLHTCGTFVIRSRRRLCQGEACAGRTPENHECHRQQDCRAHGPPQSVSGRNERGFYQTAGHVSMSRSIV